MTFEMTKHQHKCMGKKYLDVLSNKKSITHPNFLPNKGQIFVRLVLILEDSPKVWGLQQSAPPHLYVYEDQES